MIMFLYLFALSLIWQASLSFNILAIFPHYGFSHFKVFQPIVVGLAERGHHVTVITHIKSGEQHKNYEELLLSGKSTVDIAEIGEFEPKRTLTILLKEYFDLSNEGQESCQLLYESEFVNYVLKKHKKDPYKLIITEFFNSDCQFGIVAAMDLPVIGISSCALMPWYYDRIGLPDFPSFVQSEFIGFPGELNWRERLVNFLQFKVGKILYQYNTNYRDTLLIKKYLNIDIDLKKIINDHTSLIFVNQHYSLSGSRPLTPQYIEIGGVHLIRKANASLELNINSFLNNSRNGVVLISWGSVLRSSSISLEKLQIMIGALESLPYDIIWKWEADIMPTESKKFLFLKWIPQRELLAHPKVKIFWSHGGLLGTTESIHFGKPLIITPFYGDQFLNAYAVANKKVGLILNYESISFENIKTAFNSVSEIGFQDNVRHISALFNDRQTNALDNALWWIEYILSHQNASDALKLEGLKLNWFVYYSLDSILIIVLSFVISILIMNMTLKVTRIN